MLRSNLEARTYRRILYLVLALPLGVAEFAFLLMFGSGIVVGLSALARGTRRTEAEAR